MISLNDIRFYHATGVTLTGVYFLTAGDQQFPFSSTSEQEDIDLTGDESLESYWNTAFQATERMSFQRYVKTNNLTSVVIQSSSAAYELRTGKRGVDSAWYEIASGAIIGEDVKAYDKSLISDSSTTSAQLPTALTGSGNLKVSVEEFPADNLIDPATHVTAITPNDSTTFSATRALYIGSGGNLRVLTVDNDTITFTAVPIGILPIRVTKVFSTSTTASSILGLY